MAESVNRIAPVTVPLGEAEQRKRQRQEQKPGSRGQRKQGGTPAPPDSGEPIAEELPESEKTKGRHVNVRA